jgi:hypothetical protein
MTIKLAFSKQDTGTFHKQAPPPDAAEPIQKNNRKKKPISEKNLAQHKVDHENRGTEERSQLCTRRENSGADFFAVIVLIFTQYLVKNKFGLRCLNRF